MTHDPATPVISLSGVTKVFFTPRDRNPRPRRCASGNSQRRVRFIAGPSGCGKSTLLSILGLLDTPTEEQLPANEAAGAGAFAGNARLGAQSQIGSIFQSFNLIGDLTVFESVGCAHLPRHGRCRASQARHPKHCERVGMAHRAKHLPSQLSGGQQQR